MPLWLLGLLLAPILLLQVTGSPFGRNISSAPLHTALTEEGGDSPMEGREMSLRMTICVENLPPTVSLIITDLGRGDGLRLLVCPSDPNTLLDLRRLVLYVRMPSGKTKQCTMEIERGVISSIEGELTPIDTALEALVFRLPRRKGEYSAVCTVSDEMSTTSSTLRWALA